MGLGACTCLLPTRACSPLLPLCTLNSYLEEVLGDFWEFSACLPLPGCRSACLFPGRWVLPGNTCLPLYHLLAIPVLGAFSLGCLGLSFSLTACHLLPPLPATAAPPAFLLHLCLPQSLLLPLGLESSCTCLRAWVPACSYAVASPASGSLKVSLPLSLLLPLRLTTYGYTSGSLYSFSAPPASFLQIQVGFSPASACLPLHTCTCTWA